MSEDWPKRLNEGSRSGSTMLEEEPEYIEAGE
jgi:hypothetical protein